MAQLTSNSVTRPVEILSVEDDLTYIELTKMLFERTRILNNLHVVRNGIEALQFLHQESQYVDAPRPNLILLDLNMPLKDGRETLHDIKNDPHLKTIPVIIMTTSNQETDIEQSYLEHANSYITKPVSMEQFQKVVEVINAYWFTVVETARPYEIESIHNKSNSNRGAKDLGTANIKYRNASRRDLDR